MRTVREAEMALAYLDFYKTHKQESLFPTAKKNVAEKGEKMDSLFV
jgi:hypothetical protein